MHLSWTCLGQKTLFGSFKHKSTDDIRDIRPALHCAHDDEAGTRDGGDFRPGRFHSRDLNPVGGHGCKYTLMVNNYQGNLGKYLRKGFEVGLSWL